MSYDPQINPVDKIWINGSKSPGIAKVYGAFDGRKYDIQQGPFMSGAITIYRGRELAKFHVDLILLTPQDWIDWYAWKHVVDRPPFGFNPLALEIAHPWLAGLGIVDVQVEKVHQPEEDGDTGGFKITIDFLEFRAPKLTLAKPEAAGPPKPLDEQDLLIKAGRAEAEAAKMAADKARDAR